MKKVYQILVSVHNRPNLVNLSDAAEFSLNPPKKHGITKCSESCIARWSKRLMKRLSRG